MPDTLTTITNLIQSPPRPLATGAVLFGIVWGFFKGVESVLNDDTKLEIAVWLLGVKIGQKVEPWPDTLTTIFDRVFGKRHLSWSCFRRSVLSFTLCSSVLFVWLVSVTSPHLNLRSALLAYALGWCIDCLSAYFGVLQTLFWIRLLRRASSDQTHTFVFNAATLFSSLLLAIFISMGPIMVSVSLLPDGRIRGLLDSPLSLSFVFAILFPSIWLWLYAGAGFLLKAARRFDIGFEWFNRKFDIEKKPLQSIGLVAGALVAVVYWAAVIVSRMVG